MRLYLIPRHTYLCFGAGDDLRGGGIGAINLLVLFVEAQAGRGLPPHLFIQLAAELLLLKSRERRGQYG